MAVTKIWAVKDSLSRVINYARNPEKTSFEDLKKVMQYADDEDKVIFEEGEKCYLVTALNCHGDPLEDMKRIHKHFNPRGTNIAYHAYQSFKPGEVTPEQCHKIGVEFAESLWGDKYQVLVATHTNCKHLHNHFCILATSFRDGKKLDIGNNYWRRVMSPASDRICEKYGLSILGKRGKAAPRVLYEAEKSGKKTPFRLMADALETALNIATNDKDLSRYLYDMGYKIDFKTKRMGSRFGTDTVSLQKLSDTFENESFLYENFEFSYEANAMAYYDGGFGYKLSYESEMKDVRERNGVYIKRSFYEIGSLEPYPQPVNTFAKILEIMIFLLGGKPPVYAQTGKQKPYVPLTPELRAEQREARKKCEMYSHTAVIIGREHLETSEDVLSYLDKINAQLDGLVRGRKHFYYEASKADTAIRKAVCREDIEHFNDDIKTLRYERKCLVNLLERSGVMKEMIDNEMLMRKEKRDREYKKEEPIVEKPREYYPRYDEPIYRPTPKKSRDDDWDR